MNFVTISYDRKYTGLKIAYLNLIIWFSLDIYFTIIENILGASTITTILRYVTYMILSLWVILSNQGIFRKKIGQFFVIVACIVRVNSLLASWRRYVLVEAFTSLITAAPAFLIISNTKIDMRDYLKYCYPICIFHTILAIVIVILAKLEIVGYGVVATVTYSNIIILWFLYLKGIKKNIFNLSMVIINNIAGIIWGSRMPALASVVTMIFMWLFMTGKTKVCKMIWIIAMGSTFFSVLYRIENILNMIKHFLEVFNITSRSLEKFLFDIQSGNSLLGMMESSGREYIWETVFGYLKHNFVLPHGFGFVRYLTGGKYYYSHNIFSDFLILGGIFSTIFILLFLVKVREYKIRESKLNWEFLLSIIIFFLIRSITGAYFVSDKYSILAIGLVFFSKRERNEIKKI